MSLNFNRVSQSQIIREDLSEAIATPVRARRSGFLFDPTRIRGEIQKPQAFYVLPRAQIHFSFTDLKPSFISKILDSIDKPPLK